MLAGSERQQGFFDAALLAENSIYARLAQHGDQIVRDADFAECYSERWGRPSIVAERAREGVVAGLSQRALRPARDGSAAV
jgi:hypothetical protein